MTINNSHFNVGLTTPGRRAANVTPSDTVRLPFTALTLFITVGGTITYVTVAGDEIQQTVPNNYELPLQVTFVKATGTEATGIVAYG